MDSQHIIQSWAGTGTAILGTLTASSLQEISQIASIAAQIGTCLAGLATAVATIYWLVKGRKP